MKKKSTKITIIGIMLLLIGASFLPSMSGDLSRFDFEDPEVIASNISDEDYFVDERSPWDTFSEDFIKINTTFLDPYTGQWVKELSVLPGETVRVKIITYNPGYYCTGGATYVQIRYVLPSGLSYQGNAAWDFIPGLGSESASPQTDEPIVENDTSCCGDLVKWDFIAGTFQPGAHIYCYFDIIGECVKAMSTASFDAYWGGDSHVYGEDWALINCEYFVHVSDVHWGTGVTFSDDFPYLEYTDGEPNWNAFIEGKNPLTHGWRYPPKFILSTGDMVEYGAGTEGALLFELLTEWSDTLVGSRGARSAKLHTPNGIMSVPIRFCIGNHEYRHFPQLWPWSYSSYNYRGYMHPLPPIGDLSSLYYMDEYLDPIVRVFSLDSGHDVFLLDGNLGCPEGSGIDSWQLDLLEADLDALDENPNGEDDSDYLKVIMIHHPYSNPNGEADPPDHDLDGVFLNNRNRFLNILQNYSVDLVCWGHTHIPCNGLITGTTRFIDAGSLRDKNMFYKVFYKPKNPDSSGRDTDDPFLIDDPVVITSTLSMEVVGRARADAYDENGNHTGLNETGVVETEIPRSSCSVWTFNNETLDINETTTEIYLERNDTKDYHFNITGLADGFINVTVFVHLKSVSDCLSCGSSSEIIFTKAYYENIWMYEGSVATLYANESLFDYTMIIEDPGETKRYVEPTILEGDLYPNQPILTGPKSGIAGISYDYEVTTEDPENDQVYFMFDWDDGTTSGWLGPYDSGATCTTSHIWNKNVKYKVRVRAKDDGDHLSEWSDPLTVSLGCPIAYVDDDYYDGGYNDGHTWGYDAFGNIQDGIDAVIENGLVNVFSGLYSEEIVIKKTINLTGEDRTNTIINGSTELEPGEYPILNSTVVLIAAEYVNISGFTIQDGHAGIRVGQGCDYINISGNIFMDINGRDISLGSSSYSIISDNYFQEATFSLYNFRIYLGISDNNTIINNTIENSLVWGNGGGIHLWQSQNNSIYDNDIDGCWYRPGIYLDSSSNNSVTKNHIKNTTADYGDGISGIHIDNSFDNIIKENILKENYNGICIEKSDNNIISENNISESIECGIYLINYGASCDNNTIIKNNITSNAGGSCGIYLESNSGGSCDNNIIIDNNVSNNGRGIVLRSTNGASCSSNKIDNNTVSNNRDDYGIKFWGEGGGLCENNIISRNIITSNKQRGIYLESSSGNNVIVENTISNNRWDGIRLYYADGTDYIVGNTIINNGFDASYGSGIFFSRSSSDNYIVGNTITYNKNGIYLYGQSSDPCENNIIQGNTISDNNASGIRLHLQANSNYIIKNNITNNDLYGIYNDDSSNYNYIYNNNFIDNNGGDVQAYDEGVNFWNDTYPSGGNYWSDFETRVGPRYDDYQGSDQLDGPGKPDDIIDKGLDQDGGLKPYGIPNNDNKDWYPFVGLIDIIPPEIEFQTDERQLVVQIGDGIGGDGDERLDAWVHDDETPEEDIEVTLYVKGVDEATWSLSKTMEYDRGLHRGNITFEEIGYYFDAGHTVLLYKINALDETGNLAERPMLWENPLLFTITIDNPSTIVSAHSIRNHGSTPYALNLSERSVEPRLGGVDFVQFNLSGEADADGISATVEYTYWSGDEGIYGDGEDEIITITNIDGDTIHLTFADENAIPDQTRCWINLTGEVEDSFNFGTLEGDVDFDGQVLTSDASKVKARFQDPVDDTNFWYDVDCDNQIITVDASKVKSRFQHTCPPCP